jgi:hypothetical protein
MFIVYHLNSPTDITQVVAEAGLDLHNTAIRARVDSKRVENLLSGVDRVQERDADTLDTPAIEHVNRLDVGNLATEVAQNKGLDINSILDGIAQGQGSSQGQNQGGNTGRLGSGDLSASDVGGDLANQIAGGNAPGIDQILNGLNGQGRNDSRAQGTAQEQGQIAAQPTSGSGTGLSQPNAQGQESVKGQGNAQQGGGNFETIQVISTIITEPNGQQIATEIVQAVGGGQSQEVAASSAVAPKAEGSQNPTAQTTLAAAPKPEMSAAAQGSSKPVKTVFPATYVKPTVIPLGRINSTVRMLCYTTDIDVTKFHVDVCRERHSCRRNIR